MDENINYRLVGVVSALILLALFLSACADNTPASTQFSPSPLATSTAPAPTPTSAPTTSTAQSALPTTTSTRAVPTVYNAINRHEYVRAYSYWGSEVGSSNQLQPYPQFEQGYQATASVQITLGKASTQGAAGSIYTNQPVTIVARQVGSQNKTYVGCYVIRQVQPSLFGAPPFEPIRFYSAKIQEVQGNADTQALMNSACNQ